MAKAWGRADIADWQAGQGICKVCARTFCQPGEDISTIEFNGQTITQPVPVCDDCAPLVTAHYNAPDPDAFTTASLTPKWDETCPPRFKAALDLPQLPPSIDPEAFAKVNAWRFSEGCRGLYIIGPAGSGKTTSFWSLARELERVGTNPFVLTSLDLSRQLQEAARDIRTVPWLTRARVLMIDDLGKERASPAASAMFWEVLDQRYSHNLPVIVTSRFSSKELAERFGEASIGQDIRRRLFELCDPVKFTNGQADGST